MRKTLLAHTVLHVDETPVKMLAPGNKQTHQAYVWAYSSTAFSKLKAVVYDFAPGRSGENARDFLGDWSGKLVCDDYGGYKASFAQGVIDIGCMARVRRKLFDLQQASGKSLLASQVLGYIGQLNDIERESMDIEAKQIQQLWEEKARPIVDTQHQLMRAQQQRAPEGAAIAKALD